ncbi:MAG: tetratricopeptide repeat protein [Bdellovibrionales bacterium]|nr:tetratricopeptide repeat protein [Bdellovibrionales bacterium]
MKQYQDSNKWFYADLLNGLFPYAIILVMGLLIFGPSLKFNFLNFDDNIYVYENPFVQSGLRWSNIIKAFTESHGGHWHPLSWISHMLDVEFFGMNPFWHRGHNIFLHILNTCLLYLLICPRLLPKWLALLAVCIFLVHPLRIESVVWIAERKDVLSVFWGLMTLVFYFQYTNTARARFLFFSLLSYAASLLAKPTFVTLPLLLFLLDVTPLRTLPPASKRMSIFEKLPFVVLAFVSTTTAILAQNHDGGLKDVSAYTLASRFNNVPTSYLTYLGKLIWPESVAIFYPFQIYPPGIGMGTLLGLLALSYLLYHQRRKQAGLFLGWLWFLVSLLPMIGLIQIGGQAYADRWTYVPHLGLIVGLVATFHSSGWPSKKLYVFLVAYITLLSVKTLHELPNWKDSESIFRHTLVVSPDNFMAYTNLGRALEEQGRISEALENYRRAVHLRPQYPTALNNLGSALAKTQRFPEAKEYFQRALKVAPDFISARYNLGLLEFYTGNLDLAERLWQETLEKDPHYAPAIESLRHITSTALPH